MMRFYTTRLLSANLELTPEGFLLCRNVPIARTGVQLYLASELLNNDGKPLVRGNADGIVRIERDPAVVFDANTIASFEGKPVTIDHPATEVNPSNWGALAKGIVQNVRRGTGLDADYLVADLLITSADAIAKVRTEGIREVSCGYDSGYEEIEPGRGRQINIVGNHLALVEKGRCGSRCAIGDTQMKKTKWTDRLRAAFKNRDEAELEESLKEATSDEEAETEEEKKKREKKESEDRKTADALADLSARLTKLEKDSKAKDEKEESDEEKKEREEKERKESEDKKTGDSATLLAEAQDVRSRVEILSPGFNVPTHDASADAKTVRDGLCALKRAALAAAFASPKTRDAVAPLVSGVDLHKLSCDALHSTFVGASEIVRHTNNAQSKGTTDGASKPARVADSIAAMNRRNAEFWKQN